MDFVSKLLKVSAFIYVLIGGVAAIALGAYVLLACFALALAVVVVAVYIDRESKKAAWIGLGIMVLYIPSLFFWIGIPGVIAAYRTRREWAAWE